MARQRRGADAAARLPGIAVRQHAIKKPSQGGVGLVVEGKPAGIVSSAGLQKLFGFGGLPLYAAGDDTFTKTASSNTFVGKISEATGGAASQTADLGEAASAAADGVEKSSLQLEDLRRAAARVHPPLGALLELVSKTPNVAAIAVGAVAAFQGILSEDELASASFLVSTGRLDPAAGGDATRLRRRFDIASQRGAPALQAFLAREIEQLRDRFNPPSPWGTRQ